MKASEKIQSTAVALRSPKDGAEGPELVLATLVQGLTTPTAQAAIGESEETGELDVFMGVLGRWIIGHRSDDAPLLAVIELPREGKLSSQTVMERLAEARELALAGPPDLSM